MTSKVDEMLDFLALNDDPHSIEEISKALNIPYEICESIAFFLAKYAFIQKEEGKIKINAKIRDFIVASSNVEPVPQIATSITRISSSYK